MPFEGEKSFAGKRDIRYVFQKFSESPYLLVIFSAFSPKGSSPAYNYIRTLQPFSVNKLYILDDYGERGCYYLGKDRVFDVEDSVSSLISWIADTNGILKNNIISCGTSKGGFSSLYYGIKYGFGRVIAGAPQTLLGSYLKGAKEISTLEYIAGDSSSESVSYLDRLLYNVASSVNKIPEILIHVGIGDHHYKGHVIPFQEHLKSHGFDCELDIEDYNDHSNVKYYRELLIKKIIEIEPSLENAFRITDVTVERDEQNTFIIWVQANRQAQYALYVYKDNEKIDTIWYTPEPVFKYKIDKMGVYSFLVFAKDTSGMVISEKTQQYALS